MNKSESLEALNFSATQAARDVIGGGITPHFLRQLAARGLIRSVRIGGRVLFPREEILRIANEGLAQSQRGEDGGTER